ncbi:MAG: prolipoprotein diacylglyceryl transferase [Proteobacteria bacterium]|nr:prolipoprotein diacylglyceryl transferase [Pseudomonadota bacterium]
MHPDLFTIGLFGRDLTYHSYGAMIALGFALGIAIAMHNARKDSVPPDADQVFNLSLLIFAVSMGASGLIPVLMGQSFGEGLVFYFGYFGAVVTVVAYCRSKKISILRMGDLMGSGTAVGIGCGRLGCFFAGCCWGQPAAEVGWPAALANTFTHPDAFAPLGVALVPTQLALAASGFGIAAFLHLWVYPRRQWNGQVLAWFLVLYAGTRTLVEFVRDDPRGMHLGDSLSTSQLLSVPVAAVGLWMMWRAHSRGIDQPGGPIAAPGRRAPTP